MKCRWNFVAVVSGLLFLGAAANAADFTLGFEGYPAAPEKGVAGTTMAFEIYCTLTTANNASPDGAQGWSIGMGITGGAIKGIVVEGIEVSTIFQNKNPPAAPEGPYILDLVDAGFAVWRR